MSQRTKSPATPSYALDSCFKDAKTLYDSFGHATFSKTEVASSLSLSSTSSSFSGRVFALTQYGLLDSTGDSYKVSSVFHTLNGEQPESAVFKSTALRAIKRADVFDELLDEFSTKLPDSTVIAQRLEKQKKFNSDKAKKTASVLEKSMKFANVLDASNNIVPVRDDTPGGPADATRNKNVDQSTQGQSSQQEDPIPQPKTTDLRRTEIPLTDDRVVVVFYPQNLDSQEAAKVGKVLSALSA